MCIPAINTTNGTQAHKNYMGKGADAAFMLCHYLHPSSSGNWYSMNCISLFMFVREDIYL